MKNKLIGSAILLSTLGTINAIDINPFGYLGSFANFGLNEANNITLYYKGTNAKKDGETKPAGYLTLTGNVGIDFGFKNSHIGFGIAGGISPYGRPFKASEFNYGSLMFPSEKIDLSDFYYRYESNTLSVAVGRYNSNSILNTSDWLAGHHQGAAFNYQGNKFGIWGAWINDYMNTGFNLSPYYGSKYGRYGSALSVFSPYKSTPYKSISNAFSIGKKDIFAGGFDFGIGNNFAINAYGAYWLKDGYWSREGKGNKYDLAQLGLRATAVFNINFVQSATTFRTLWQNSIKLDNDYGMLFWGDQEFLLYDIFKIGGGYISLGKKFIASLADRTRFYGQFLTSNKVGSSTLQRPYLSHTNIWYIFGGIELINSLTFDMLYAGGSYKEISAIVNWEVVTHKNFAWSLGGGIVTNSYKILDKTTKTNVLGFTKVAF